MRRALSVLLAGLAMPALAQSFAVHTGDPSTINIAQCTGTTNAVRGGDDKLDVGLDFTVALAAGKAFNTVGKYRIWASNVVPSVDPAKGRACETSDNTGTAFRRMVKEFDATAQTMSDQRVNLHDIAAAAEPSTFDCTSGTASQPTIYLCVQWVDTQDGSAANGWASGLSLTLDLTAPTNPPTSVNVQPGDSKLHVSCTGNDSLSKSFKALATGASDSKWSNQVDGACSGMTIDGLQNGQPYAVVVYGLSEGFNPGPPSDAVNGTPIPTDDFYKHYKNSGGHETGGCSTAAGAAGLLSALGLLALRRRKP